MTTKVNVKIKLACYLAYTEQREQIF